MLDGAKTMFQAYQQTTTRRDSIDQVKLGLKECTQVCCLISMIENLFFLLDFMCNRSSIRSDVRYICIESTRN